MPSASSRTPPAAETHSIIYHIWTGIDGPLIQSTIQHMSGSAKWSGMDATQLLTRDELVLSQSIRYHNHKTLQWTTTTTTSKNFINNYPLQDGLLLDWFHSHVHVWGHISSIVPPPPSQGPEPTGAATGSHCHWGPVVTVMQHILLCTIYVLFISNISPLPVIRFDTTSRDSKWLDVWQVFTSHFTFALKKTRASGWYVSKVPTLFVKLVLENYPLSCLSQLRGPHVIITSHKYSASTNIPKPK